MDSAPSTRKQVGGDHYTRSPMQPWDVLPHWLGMDGYRKYLRGNALKYLFRAGSKQGSPEVEDYEKALHYLEELIRSHKHETPA